MTQEEIDLYILSGKYSELIPIMHGDPNLYSASIHHSLKDVLCAVKGVNCSRETRRALVQFLSYTFAWEETPQGWDFWRAVSEFIAFPTARQPTPELKLQAQTQLQIWIDCYGRA